MFEELSVSRKVIVNTLRHPLPKVARALEGALDHKLIDYGESGGFLAIVVAHWGDGLEGVELQVFQLSRKALDEIKEAWRFYLDETKRRYCQQVQEDMDKEEEEEVGSPLCCIYPFTW